MPDPAVVQPRRVLSKWVCQPNLVDHPDIQPDVHPQHAEVGEKYRVLRLLGRLSIRGRARRRLDHGYQVPLCVVAGRQQQRPFRGIVERDQNGSHPRIIQVVRSGQRMGVPGGLGVETALVDDSRVGDAGGVITHSRRVCCPQRPACGPEPQQADGTGQPVTGLPRVVVATRSVERCHGNDGHRSQQTKERRQQNPAMHEIATLPNPVERL